MSGPERSTARGRFHAKIPAPLRHGLVIFILVLIVEYLVVPELIGASRNVHLLSKVNVGLVIVGVILEAVALFCYALLTRTLLPPGGPNISTIFRIDLATTAVAHIIPAGTVGSAGLGYRLLTSHGVKGTDAGVRLATQGMGSAIVLNVLLWFSLVISIPFAGFHTLYVTVALVGMLALLAVAALAYAFTRGEESATRFVRAISRRVHWVSEDRVERVVRQIGDSLRQLASDRDRLKRALLWASLNWLADAASLGAFVLAFGRFVNPVLLFAAYGIANVLAVIPITPGGLGLVDATAPLMLVSFGVKDSVAVLGVLGWRLVNFWLPIPVGTACYISLRLPRRSSMRARRAAIHEMAAEANNPENAPPDLTTGEPTEPTT